MINLLKGLTMLLITVMCHNAIAQSEKTTSGKDGIFLRNQHMVVMKQGTIAPLMSDQTMSDGTVIKTNGTIIKPNGTTLTLNEGQKIDFAGNLMPEVVSTYLSIQNGKVVMETNGVSEPVENDIKLSNGAVLTKEGTILMDGGTQQLKSGEKIDLKGNRSSK